MLYRWIAVLQGLSPGNHLFQRIAFWFVFSFSEKNSAAKKPGIKNWSPAPAGFFIAGRPIPFPSGREGLRSNILSIAILFMGCFAILYGCLKKFCLFNNMGI